MNARTEVTVGNTPIAEHSYLRQITVTVSVSITNAGRGDAVVGTVEKAMRGALEVVKEARRQ